MTIVERETVAPMPDVLDPRVVRGAELLDERMPGWAEKIDPDSIKIGSYCGCIVGRTFDVRNRDNDAGTGDYFRAMVHLGVLERPILGGFDRQAEFGFFVPFDGDEKAITQDWRLAILSRRSA